MGTPLPEPPDELPRPELADFGPEVTAAGEPTMVTQIPISVTAGRQGARLWVVNLDRAEVAPVERAARDDGPSMLTILAASGDRIRIVSRTDRAHSGPLDLVVLPPADTSIPANRPSIEPLGDTGLSCLDVSPRETLVLSGTRGTIELKNRCAVTVELTRAALRLADQGIALAEPPTVIAPGEHARLSLEDEAGPEPRQRADIVLLDVQAADGRIGRYAIDIFTDPK